MSPFVVWLIKKLYKASWSLDYIVIFVFFIIFALLFLVKMIWNEVSFRAYSYPKNKLYNNHYIKEKIVNYKINKSGHLNYSKELKVVSNINSLESILGRYIWTGDSETNLPKSKKKNIKSICEEEFVGIWKHYRIILARGLKKGEEETIGLEWPSIERPHTSSPFIATDTEIPIKRLVFKVDLGEEYAGADVLLEEYSGVESTFPLLSKEDKFDENGRYEWVVPRIKRFRNYMIRWSWIDDE